MNHDNDSDTSAERFFGKDDGNPRFAMLSTHDVDTIVAALEDAALGPTSEGVSTREDLTNLIDRLTHGDDDAAKVCNECRNDRHLDCALEWVVVASCDCTTCRLMALHESTMWDRNSTRAG